MERSGKEENEGIFLTLKPGLELRVHELPEPSPEKEIFCLIVELNSQEYVGWQGKLTDPRKIRRSTRASHLMKPRRKASVERCVPVASVTSLRAISNRERE